MKDFHLVPDELSLMMTAVLGRARMSAGAIRQLRTGSLVLLDEEAGGPITLELQCESGGSIARGELVIIDGKLGIRVRAVCASDGGWVLGMASGPAL